MMDFASKVQIKSILVLDLDGTKIIGRDYDELIGSSKQYQKKLFVNTKTHRVKDEILMIDHTLVVHQFITDLHFYVIGNRNENPLLLDSVLECLVEVVGSLTNKNIDRQQVLNNMAKIILALDEICGDGLILETDSKLVLQRVCLKDDAGAGEQTMAQKLQSATEQFKFSWIRSYS